MSGQLVRFFVGLINSALVKPYNPNSTRSCRTSDSAQSSRSINFIQLSGFPWGWARSFLQIFKISLSIEYCSAYFRFGSFLLRRFFRLSQYRLRLYFGSSSTGLSVFISCSSTLAHVFPHCYFDCDRLHFQFYLIEGILKTVIESDCLTWKKGWLEGQLDFKVIIGDRI